MPKAKSQIEPWCRARAEALAAGREPQAWIVLSDSDCTQLLAWADLPDPLRSQLTSLQDWTKEQESVVTRVDSVPSDRPLGSPAFTNELMSTPDEHEPRCGGTGMVAYWDGRSYAGEMCPGCIDCEGPDEA